MYFNSIGFKSDQKGGGRQFIMTAAHKDVQLQQLLDHGEELILIMRSCIKDADVGLQQPINSDEVYDQSGSIYI